MATFLDASLLENFGIIFIVLLVFLILYGLLEYMKAFGEDKRGVRALIAFFVALMFLISRTAASMVQMMVPWFIVMIIFIFFTLFMVRMFGRTESDLRSLIGSKDVYPWLIIFLVLILLFSLGNAFGQSLLERGEGKQTTNTSMGTGTGYGLEPAEPGTRSTTTASFTTNFLNTLRHPKVLGMLFIFLVGLFSLIFLTKPSA